MQGNEFISSTVVSRNCHSWSPSHFKTINEKKEWIPFVVSGLSIAQRVPEVDIMKVVLWIVSFWLALPALAGHTFKPIDVCYHWLEPRQLQAKIDFAEKNNGKFYFYDSSVPTYCWRTPFGSYSRNFEHHGDMLIRIKLRHVPILHAPRTNVERMKEPIYYSNDNHWHEYTVTPAAIESWSIYHPGLIAELEAELEMYRQDLVTEDDVFYPAYSFKRYRNAEAGYLPGLIANMKANVRKAKIYGENIENHFNTIYPDSFPFRRFIDPSWLKRPTPWERPEPVDTIDGVGGVPFVEEPAKVQVIEASYGLNLGAQNKGNATQKAADFCKGRRMCRYKISPRFLGFDPAPNDGKSFEITWKCGGRVQTQRFAAPADDTIFEMNCQ